MRDGHGRKKGFAIVYEHGLNADGKGPGFSIQPGDKRFLVANCRVYKADTPLAYIKDIIQYNFELQASGHRDNDFADLVRMHREDALKYKPAQNEVRTLHQKCTAGGGYMNRNWWSKVRQMMLDLEGVTNADNVIKDVCAHFRTVEKSGEAQCPLKFNTLSNNGVFNKLSLDMKREALNCLHQTIETRNTTRKKDGTLVWTVQAKKDPLVPTSATEFVRVCTVMALRDQMNTR